MGWGCAEYNLLPSRGVRDSNVKPSAEEAAAGRCSVQNRHLYSTKHEPASAGRIQRRLQELRAARPRRWMPSSTSTETQPRQGTDPAAPLGKCRELGGGEKPPGRGRSLLFPDRVGKCSAPASPQVMGCQESIGLGPCTSQEGCCPAGARRGHGVLGGTQGASPGTGRCFGHGNALARFTH